MCERKEPPIVLVKTWIELIRSSEDDEAKKRASEMLLAAFGDMKKASEFVHKHGLFK